MTNPKNNQTTQTKKLNGTEIASQIASTIKIMKRNWDLIRVHNVLDKRLTPSYDLKKIYEQNQFLESRIIRLKSAAMCLNLGLDLSVMDKKNNCQPTVFTRSQLKSRLDNLETISTKHNEKTEKVTFSSDFILKEKNKLKQEILKLEGELDAFNTQFSIAI